MSIIIKFVYFLTNPIFQLHQTSSYHIFSIMHQNFKFLNVIKETGM